MNKNTPQEYVRTPETLATEKAADQSTVENVKAETADVTPVEPSFGEDYDEKPAATIDDADFDADEQNTKEVTE